MDTHKTIQELEEQVYSLEQIIQNINEGVILTDRECRIKLFNPAKEDMEQMKAREVLGQVSWRAYARSNREISEHQRVLDTGEPILNAYRPHAYVGDVPVYIYYSTYPVVRDGQVLGVYTISRNESLLRKLLYETIEHKRQLSASGGKVKKKHLAKGTHFTFEDFVGNSPAMKQVLKDAQTIAALNASILITGETGTGKEVLAQSIHNLGREKKKFIAINCAAIPETLLESTLFGSVKGAYTGAVDSTGLFRDAEDGTLFLDEINSMSTVMQAKLLRALQEKCVRPVGSLQEHPIRCRLICASNEEPKVLLREKRLRHDLFYRISDFILTIPPLRERPEDLIELAEMFIRKYNKEFVKNIKTMAPQLTEILVNHTWPGNTRELEHVIQNMMLRVSEVTEVLDERDYPDYLTSLEKDVPAIRDESYLSTANLNETLRKIQREIIETRLAIHRGNLTKTAATLGLQRQNLAARMKRLGIQSGE